MSRRVFISYAREDRSGVDEMASDLRHAKMDVWYDARLAGGDPWWTEILRNIRECDTFVFALSEWSMASEACRREYGYARDLRRRVLPVRMGELPVVGPELDDLSGLHQTPYRTGDKTATFDLLAALEALPPAGPLPSPLPSPPPRPRPEDSGRVSAVRTETTAVPYSTLRGVAVEDRLPREFPVYHYRLRVGGFKTRMTVVFVAVRVFAPRSENHRSLRKKGWDPDEVVRIDVTMDGRPVPAVFVPGAVPTAKVQLPNGVELILTYTPYAGVNLAIDGATIDVETTPDSGL
ncbi:toll/interleukin-1 receptor domain-containing protein [Cryptosporangium aurantiacum]|uniref:TIR domain-containing protein n=1 Tax=Cryptosporangium aurantiacum TaxID=134849 RepID=A0A1M7TYB6_9ACTN|nr:toll/interleukin-1 receptor domain-containing protein [Cryptosporangium aurantiacum]SHN75698.1 TIR domain-containing protein [Cryptosporangium aurantiacum]